MWSAVLFDLDGTLIDHEAAAQTAVLAWTATLPGDHGHSEEVLARRWLSIEQDHFGAYLAGVITFEEQRRARASAFLSFLGLTPCSAHHLDEHFSRYLRHYEAAWCAYDDAAPALRDLRAAGVVLGVLTNGQEAQQRAKLAAVNLLAELDCVVASSTLTAAKPAAEAFLEASGRLGVPPGEVLYVGDNLATDALAATAAGMWGVWLNRSGLDADAGPCEVIGSLREVVALLMTLRSI